MAWEAEAPGPHQPAPLLSCFWLGLATETPAGDRRVETGHFFPFSARPEFGRGCAPCGQVLVAVPAPAPVGGNGFWLVLECSRVFIPSTLPTRL